MANCFITPPENQNQAVEVSYCASADGQVIRLSHEPRHRREAVLYQPRPSLR
jgi:hypothetical protein